jgi:crotonobetainyl-CoA:carnitine CoA-transferase CaiB-like acyl-CoA transferase
MADMGADVIKIERPDGGDGARRMGPFPGDEPDTEASGLFLYLNTNKKGITLNLKTETGKTIFKDMLRDADILVENFQPRVMPSLGLSYEVLESINPKLVMTSITNFGQTGPYRDYRAIELNLAALGGSMYVTGSPDREPLKEPGSTFQFAAGADACGATLAATFSRRQSGLGQHVDLSIMETVIACSPHAVTWGRTKLVTRRAGPYSRANVWPKAVAVNGTYECKDGYVVVVLRNPEDAVLAASLTGIDEIGSPEMGCIGFGKIVNSERMNELLIEGFRDKTKEEIFHTAQELRLFWTDVKSIDEVFNWRHYQERGFWTKIDHPKTGPITYARVPFIMSEAPMGTGRAPLLGEHNEDIYMKQMGYSSKELSRLKELDVI